jgi:hypothetical protein
MNALRVSNRAGRRSGKLLFASALMLVPALKAGEVIYTVTGTVSVGIDGRNFFGLGKKIPEGTPFTAVATFDDTKARLNTDEGGCPESESSVIGGSLYDYYGRTYPSAGTATVTINGRSIEFGKTPTAGSQVSRYFQCSCNNMPSKISILVVDGVWKGMGPSPYAAFTITVEAPEMRKGTTWSTPGTFTKVSGTLSMNMFGNKGTWTSLNVKSIVVTRK